MIASDCGGDEGSKCLLSHARCPDQLARKSRGTGEVGNCGGWASVRYSDTMLKNRHTLHYVRIHRLRVGQEGVFDSSPEWWFYTDRMAVAGVVTRLM